MEQGGQQQVQVRFVTQQTKHVVPDTAILVPAELRRYGLSGIVNSMLGYEKPVPFDFLIEGEILRTSIAQYLLDHRLSTENVLTIEYVESMLPPQSLAAFQHDDWISSVKARHGLYLTGSYDNMARLWNSSGECVATFIGHKDAVKSVAFGSKPEDEDILVFSGSLDHSILAWKYNESGESPTILYECKGHKATVESIAVDAQYQYVASASADGTVKVWTTAEPMESEIPPIASQEAPSKKRKKVEEPERTIKAKALTLEGHVGAVNAVTFDATDSNVVYTGGWDHSIRSWDVENETNLVTKNCEKVVLDVDYSAHSRLIATGHTDNVLRLWDPRSEDGTNVKLALRGHTGWISSVSWSPKSEYTLCSGSYDATVRVWDIRSKGPLYTVNADDNDDSSSKKVLSVDWSGDQIVCGGEDKKLQIFKTNAH